jgi:hypothetical protein
MPPNCCPASRVGIGTNGHRCGVLECVQRALPTERSITLHQSSCPTLAEHPAFFVGSRTAGYCFRAGGYRCCSQPNSEPKPASTATLVNNENVHGAIQELLRSALWSKTRRTLIARAGATWCPVSSRVLSRSAVPWTTLRRRWGIPPKGPSRKAADGR